MKILYSSILFLVIFSISFLNCGEKEPVKPNIIYILADDLGYGDLGCYGQEKIKTPNIDQLASEGIRFTDHYAGSTVCAPSRCCLMTGLHTGHARIRGNARTPLLPDDITVAELLKSAGYTTGLIGKWGLGEPGTTGIPNKQGFDYFLIQWRITLGRDIHDDKSLHRLRIHRSEFHGSFAAHGVADECNGIQVVIVN